MYLLLLTLLVIDAFLLITIVLLQAGKGGGLAAMGAAGAGTDSLFGSRQTATLLTKATWWAGGVFLVLAFFLTLMAGRTVQPESILRGSTTAPAATSPALPVTGTAPQPTTTAPVTPTAPAATAPDSQ